MNQPNPASATTDIPDAEIVPKGRFRIPGSKKTVTTEDVAATAKSTKDKVKTGLALVGVTALGLVVVGAVTKRKTGDDTVAVTLPSIDTTSSDDTPTV